ncbi:hypothetical protein JCM6882_006564 [Rhodosporidiobolus microsporus]
MEADRFVQDLPEYLTCSVCLESAWRPVLVCAAEHILCEKCHAGMVRASARPACPQCRLPFLVPARFSQHLTRALDSLKIRCKDGRCRWTGTISEEGKHRASQCNYRLVKCPECAVEYAFQDRSLHLDRCPNAYIQCERGGADCGSITGNGLFMRKNKNHHDQLCASYRCTATVGCYTRTTRKNLATHESQCAALSRKLSDLKAELESAKVELAKQGVKLHRAQEEKRGVEKQLDSLMGAPAVKYDERGRKIASPIVPRDPTSSTSASRRTSRLSGWAADFNLDDDVPSPPSQTAGRRLLSHALGLSSSLSSSPPKRKESPKKKKKATAGLIDLTDEKDSQDDDLFFLPPPEQVLSASSSSSTARQSPKKPSTPFKRSGPFDMVDPEMYDSRGRKIPRLG